MPSFLVSFDFVTSDLDSAPTEARLEKLVEHLRSLGDCRQTLSFQWVLRAPQSADELRRILGETLGKNDRLVIAELLNGLSHLWTIESLNGFEV